MFDMMHRMLEDNIAPTANALEQAYLHGENKKTHLNQYPASIHYFLTHDGRSVQCAAPSAANKRLCSEGCAVRQCMATQPLDDCVTSDCLGIFFYPDINISRPPLYGIPT